MNVHASRQTSQNHMNCILKEFLEETISKCCIFIVHWLENLIFSQLDRSAKKKKNQLSKFKDIISFFQGSINESYPI